MSSTSSPSPSSSVPSSACSPPTSSVPPGLPAVVHNQRATKGLRRQGARGARGYQQRLQRVLMLSKTLAPLTLGRGSLYTVVLRGRLPSLQTYQAARRSRTNRTQRLLARVKGRRSVGRVHAWERRPCVRVTQGKAHRASLRIHRSTAEALNSRIGRTRTGTSEPCRP